MASINSVVTISITANSRTPSRAGFGKPCVMTYHTVFGDAWREYSDLAGMISDGFSVNSNAYLIVQSIFNQDPTVKSVVVGRMNACPAFTQVLTVTSSTQGAHVRAKCIDSAGVVQQLDYTIGAAETTTTVATAFELLTEAVTGQSSTSSGASITITPDSANGFKPTFFDLENCGVHETTADAAYDTSLIALEPLKNDWYFVLADSSSPANVAKIAAYVLSRVKLYFVSTQSDLELGGTGTMASSLVSAANNRTVLLYAFNPQEHAAAAWTAVGAAKDPGTITWANKGLLGVTAKDLTTTQETTLTGNNVNNYQSIAGLGATRPGVVSSGEWIDVMHGTDALKSDMQIAVWTVIANADKIAFTDAHLDLISSAILGVLRKYEGSTQNPGLLVPGKSNVQMPSADSISAADKKARRLRGVRFSGKYASAVHAVDLIGTIDY